MVILAIVIILNKAGRILQDDSVRVQFFCMRSGSLQLMGRKDVLVVRTIDPDYDVAYLSSSYRIGMSGISFDYYF